MGETVLPVSVVIPTIGRTDLLASCVRSVLGCSPAPRQVVVSDQSGGGAVRKAIASIGGSSDVTVIESAGRGIAKATNDGIAATGQDIVLVTHDDCTVASDWVGVGAALHERDPGALYTGRVLPPDGSRYVPSTIVDPEPRDYTGMVTSGVLYPANMVFGRETMVDFGGFDERPGLRLAAEDNDLCYRWLLDGRPLRYEPALKVWHHDWRDPEQLLRTHRVYARGQGAFYGKHLALGDRRILGLLRWDLERGLRAAVRGRLQRAPRWTEPYREMTWLLAASTATAWWRERRGARPGQ